MGWTPVGRTANGVWSGEPTSARTRPLISVGEAWSALVEPSTLRMRISALERDSWSSTAIVVGEVQPMSRMRLVPGDSHRIGRARGAPIARPSASYRMRLGHIVYAHHPR